jgi:putative hemolysin
MSDVVPQLLLVVVLVIINAAFAGTELALVSLREGQLKRLESRSSTGALLARLARQPNQFLATIQIGITLAGFLASAAAAVSLAEPLEEPLSVLGGAAGPVSIIVVTLLLSYVTLVFGELAPKRVAMQKAEQWGMVMARPLAVMTRLTRPIVWLLSHSTDLAVRLMGADPDLQREEVTTEELRELVATQPTFTEEQRLIIDGAFEVAERSLDKVLVPRADVFVLDADLACDHALRALVESGHSRAPVATGGNLDEVIGVIHMRQLLDLNDVPVATVVASLPAFPGAAKVLTSLREMQTQRAQMALVIDEHGSTEGIITMEDLVEELVGEIYDETDRDIASARYEPGGIIVLPGRFPIHDLRDIGIDLPEGDYATMAGFVLDALGRLPEQGETIDVDGWRIVVRTMHHHAITEISLVRN